jgi:DNA-binding response OmpR family regulator
MDCDSSAPNGRGATNAARAAPQRTGVAAAERTCVMIVDDDPEILSLVASALEVAGHDVVVAENGMKAAELLGAASRPPDVLICDVMMPVVDGFTLARFVKKDKALRSVPIIFLSARTRPADIVNGIALGARHYVQKPFRIAELVDKVARTINAK